MSKRLFVGNLSFDISEAELTELFAPYGATSASIPTNDSGRPRGFGFVELPDDQVAAAIAAWDGKEMRGRTVAVNEARPRTEVGHWGNGGARSGGGRGGYGGGGGRGGGRGGRW
jgi:RNA recognition motif-containing protein